MVCEDAEAELPHRTLFQAAGQRSASEVGAFRRVGRGAESVELHIVLQASGCHGRREAGNHIRRDCGSRLTRVNHLNGRRGWLWLWGGGGGLV